VIATSDSHALNEYAHAWPLDSHLWSRGFILTNQKGPEDCTPTEV
jgi:hypothetical protein